MLKKFYRIGSRTRSYNFFFQRNVRHAVTSTNQKHPKHHVTIFLYIWFAQISA